MGGETWGGQGEIKETEDARNDRAAPRRIGLDFSVQWQVMH
jgi:hypothetical protein